MPQIIGLFTLITIIYKLTPDVLFDYALFVYLEQYLTIGLVVIIFIFIEQQYLKKQAVNFSSFFYLKKIHFNIILLSLAVVIFMQPINYYIAQITDLFFEPAEISDYERNVGFIAGLLNMALMPAICEEFLFRGALLRYQQIYMKNKLMIILFNGFLFGLFHFNLTQFFYTCFMGIMFSYITLQTRSIFPVIIIHFLSNLLSTLQPEDQGFPSFSYLIYFESIHSLRFNLIFILSSILLIWILRKLSNTSPT